MADQSQKVWLQIYNTLLTLYWQYQTFYFCDWLQFKFLSILYKIQLNEGIKRAKMKN